MNIKELLQQSKEIWGDEKLPLSQIVVRLGKVFGDICRWERNEYKEKNIHTDDELKKEMGNLIFSSIKFCDHLDYDPEECVNLAINCQKKYVENSNSFERVDKKESEEVLGKLRDVWGDDLSDSELIMNIGKTFGQLCEVERNLNEGNQKLNEKIKKDLSDAIVSAINHYQSLGYNSDEIIQKAIESKKMKNNNLKLVIGIITYEAAKYLPHFLPSLEAQTFKDFKVLILDNNEKENSENKKFFQNYKSKIDIDFEWAGENLGFAKGFNKLIRKAKDYNSEYFMMMNPDMVLEPDMIEKMINAMDNDGNLGSASPKIKVWDFKNNKKINKIDSCGIVVNSGLRFVDAGQGQEDKGQFDKAKILGPSGTVPIYRMSALEETKTSPQPSPYKGGGDKSEYFDELMFMYKEDCDLVYRLFLDGFTSRLVSDAVCYHDRSVKGEGEGSIKVALNRKNKSRQAKKWSFLNQQIIFVKYWRLQSFIGKLAIIWYQLKILIFVLIFEQYLLKELITLFNISKKIKRY